MFYEHQTFSPSRPPSFHFGATGATDFVAQFILGGGFRVCLSTSVQH
jgi:hypothetical protein